MKTLIRSLIVSIAAAVAPLSFAQVYGVNATGFNLIAGAITSSTSTMIITGHDWSSVPSGTVVSSGTHVTAGKNQNTSGTISMTASGATLADASARGTVIGAGLAGTDRIVEAHFFGGSTPVSVVIWGHPTLSQFGVLGSDNFAWEIQSSAGYSSGTGEANVSGHWGTISVYVRPTYYYEYGDVVIRAVP